MTLTEELVERQQCELIEELEDLEGQNLAIATLGGWVIGGNLGEVKDCVAVIGAATQNLVPLLVLGAVTVFGPAFPSPRILGTPVRVRSNLRTLTDVLLP